ncbi:MAG: hypothetical protein GF421_07760 [Candidatus Aminicenantes bacterium]|nr:hypothetical protein [Candidatus Aminicenantes bacterium]
MNKNKESSPSSQDIKNQVSAPAIGLLITGIVGAVSSLGTLISLVIGISFLSIPSIYSELPDDIPIDMEHLFQGTFAIGSSFVGILVAALIIFASLKMKELEQWGLALMASILAMIPCISPCCIIGLPIGIWCLVVLTKPEIKNAFS